MSAETPEKKEYQILTPDKEEVVNIAKNYFALKSNDENAKEKYSKRVRGFKNFRESVLKSFDPRQYLLWHEAIGSNGTGLSEFDTPNRDIEKYIKQQIKFEKLSDIVESSVSRINAEKSNIEEKQSLLRERSNKINPFYEKMNSLGFDLDNYIFGRKLIGSSDKEGLPFDIADESNPGGPGLIEKFIRENL